MKLLFLVLMVLFVGCSNDAVSSHEVVPIAGDISSSAVAQSSSSMDIVEHSSSSREESCSSAEEMASSSSESLSSSSESAGSSSSSEQESSSSSVQEESSSSKERVVFGEMTDERDGHVYKTVTIDGQSTWMAENLNYAYLQPTTTLDSSSWCYNNDPDNCAKYGRLYLWSAVMDSAGLFSSDTKGCGEYSEGWDLWIDTDIEWYKCPKEHNVRGVCPEHWHVPSSSEFYAPASVVQLPPIEWQKKMPVGFDYDANPSKKGFDILPAGKYESLYDDFNSIEYEAYLWLSTEIDYIHAYAEIYPRAHEVGERKYMAFSVRCVKDEEVEE